MYETLAEKNTNKLNTYIFILQLEHPSQGSFKQGKETKIKDIEINGVRTKTERQRV